MSNLEVLKKQEELIEMIYNLKKQLDIRNKKSYKKTS